MSRIHPTPGSKVMLGLDGGFQAAGAAAAVGVLIASAVQPPPRPVAPTVSLGLGTIAVAWRL
jgi:hypothetical protein